MIEVKFRVKNLNTQTLAKIKVDVNNNYTKVKARFMTQALKKAKQIARETVEKLVTRRPNTHLLSEGVANSLRLTTRTNDMIIDYRILKRAVVYWKSIDVGGYIPPKVLGAFGNEDQPSKGGKGKRWEEENDEFMITPKKQVKGKHYIEKVIYNLRPLAREVAYQITQSLKSGTRG